MNRAPVFRRRRRIATGVAASVVVVALTVLDVPRDLNGIDRVSVQAGATEPPTAGTPPVDLSWVPTSREWRAGDCASFFATAMDAGWTWIDWPTLAGIMGGRPGHPNGESGCQPNVSRLKGRDASYGLLAINTKGRLWWAPIGYGETRSLRELCGLAAPEDLLVAETNLRCGRLLFDVYAAWGASHPGSGITGWKPWT